MRGSGVAGLEAMVRLRPEVSLETTVVRDE